MHRKGTISKKLIKDFPIKPVSFGDLLRDNVQKKTELGTQVEEIMKKGQLVPDSIIFQLLNNLQTESKESILLDGFPRTLKQATESASSFSIDAVAVLDIPKQTIIERLSDRWVRHHLNTRMFFLMF
jgi:nucleoside-triphosphate--adenylate kinase